MMMLYRYAATAVLVASLHAAEFATGADWPSYGGTHASLRYSALDQIHTGNVDRLVAMLAFVFVINHLNDFFEKTL